MKIMKGFADLSNVKMYYEAAGEGEPLLFIHGIDSDSRMWEPQFEFFARIFQTIRFDLRGFGNTTMPEGDFQLLDDIHDLLKELNVESAHIVGYSYGGTVAPAFALKYPNRVKSLTLAGAAMIGHKWSEEVSNYFTRFQESYKQNNLQEMMRLLKWKSVYGPFREEKGLEPICDLLETMFLHALSIVPRDGNPLPIGDSRAHLGEIMVPTLVLAGELDFPDYHEIASIYADKIPNSVKKIIPDAAHFMNLEKPNVFNNEVMSFIQKIKSRYQKV